MTEADGPAGRGPDLIVAAQAAASPLLSGSPVLFQWLQTMLDHEAGGDLMLGPLDKTGFPPAAPLAPDMTKPDIDILRCHFPIAGQTPAQPWLAGAGIRLQRL